MAITYPFFTYPFFILTLRSTERFLMLSCLAITVKHDFDEKIAILIFNVEVLKWNTYTGIISRIWCVEWLVAPWRLTSKGYQTGSLMGIFPWRNKARRKPYSLRPRISDVKAPHAFDLRWYNIHVIRKEVGRERRVNDVRAREEKCFSTRSNLSDFSIEFLWIWYELHM